MIAAMDRLINIKLLIFIGYDKIKLKTMTLKNFLQKFSWWIIVALIITILTFVLFWFNLLPFNLTATTKYQAVFLSNGQVYFGQFKGEKGDYAILTNIYYLQQVSTPVQQIQPQAPETSPDIRLVKLGSELHGPEDMMYIAKSQILFYEDLKDDSRVVQAIKAFENK